MKLLSALANVFTDISTLIASLGLVLATSSFISGLQLVRGTRTSLEGKIHRFNGYGAICVYVTLAAMSFAEDGMRLWPAVGWFSGAGLIALKITIVRRRKRAFKYVSWMGASLILIWLFMVYVHIPV